VIRTAVHVRDARAEDLGGIAALDALRAGAAKPGYWRRILEQYGGPAGPRERVALVAVDGTDAIVGFLFGEVRAWEFGSERCGWIFSVAVCPTLERGGLATALCQEAAARFEALGVDLVRTMVRRNDVPMLALFRSMGYRAGPFSELECRIAAAAPVVRRTQRRKKEVV
jgi:ribosomal protein S18 acetylase RimI-like enzyme